MKEEIRKRAIIKFALRKTAQAGFKITEIWDSNPFKTTPKNKEEAIRQLENDYYSIVYFENIISNEKGKLIFDCSCNGILEIQEDLSGLRDEDSFALIQEKVICFSKIAEDLDEQYLLTLS